jgi:ferrochelatase
VGAIERELAEHGPQLPVYWGNRNWHPLLPDTLRKMTRDGVRRALAFVTSGFSSYSGCRQYRENIAAAQTEVGSSAPVIDKLRVFYNHPGFIEPMIELTRRAYEQIPVERRQNAVWLFSAHSIPLAMAQACRYEEQLREACRLVAEGVGRTNWQLVYQSRSGPPHQPWLEPDINNFIRGVADIGAPPSSRIISMSGGSRAPSLSDGLLDRSHPIRDVVVVPIGFISDHMEVLYDLDTEVRQLCEQLEINLVRADTVGTHPRFVRMICELIEERMTSSPQRLALGTLGPSHDVCPDDCCLKDMGQRAGSTG